MPNWAYTSYAVEGPKETLQKIEQAILHHPVVENSSGDWEGNVLEALDIKWVSRDQDRENGLYMRGFIHEEPWWIDDNVLRFCADEAWNVTDLDEALLSAFPDIKVYWVTEEEGMGIYATNDKEGKYFPDRFFVDTCINGNYQSNYFSRESNAYYWLSKITEGKVKTKEEVEAFNDDVDRDPDDFIYVHEYRIIN